MIEDHILWALPMPFQKLDPPPDSISLLIGAEADRERRRSSQINVPASPGEHMHKRLPHLFSSHDTDTDSESEAESEDGNGVEGQSADYGFLGRTIGNYNRLMHAHTKSQLAAPATGTVPSYTKTMHSFTLNQLSHHRHLQISKSETSSPHLGPKHAVIPSKLRGELTQLSREEIPHGPSNTPERDEMRGKDGDVQGIDFRKLRRSITEPLPEDFAVVKTKDFAYGV